MRSRYIHLQWISYKVHVRYDGCILIMYGVPCSVWIAAHVLLLPAWWSEVPPFASQLFLSAKRLWVWSVWIGNCCRERADYFALQWTRLCVCSRWGEPTLYSLCTVLCFFIAVYNYNAKVIWSVLYKYLWTLSIEVLTYLWHITPLYVCTGTVYLKPLNDCRYMYKGCFVYESTIVYTWRWLYLWKIVLCERYCWMLLLSLLCMFWCV